MGRVYQPKYTKPGPNGTRVTVAVKSWYVEYTDGGGTQRRKKIGTKRAAESALARFQEEADRKRHGLPDPVADATARNRPATELMTEYLAELEHNDRDDAYRAGVKKHLEVIAAACGWYTWGDLTSAPLTKFLANKRQGTKAKRGVSPATANGYLRSAKGFAKWYADKIEVRSPLATLKSMNEQVDRRRSRRVLTDPEFGKFLAATEATPERHNAHFTGKHRAALYRVAAYTGLRASELAALTPECFDLGAETVTVPAKDTKGKRHEPLPIEDSLLKFLKGWLPAHPPGKRLWWGRWARDRRQVKWVGRDAKRAGLGTGVTFHSLRLKFVTDLFGAGASPDDVRKLARHKSVTTTLNNYAETGMAGLKKAVNRLQPLG